MDWKSIKTLLRLNEEELEELEKNNDLYRFPPALLVNYHDVQNIVVRKMNQLSRKHFNDKTSVQLWLNYLKEKRNCETLFIQHPHDGPFLVSWLSSWQLDLLKQAKEWCLDSTHKTCISFNNPNDSCFLFTIIIKNPATNKGVPVCFFLTDAERQSVLVQWLRWLIDVAGPLPVEKIMIDCSQTEISAIREVFGESLNVLLCHWHIKRAWEKHLKTDVKIRNSTMESVQARATVRSTLNNLMYAEEEEEYDRVFAAFEEKYKDSFGTFVAYYIDNWHKRRQYWARPWRKDASFDTNNLIESYHNQLKSNYFGRSRNTRVDRIIYLLSQVVIVDYRQDALRVQIGSKQFYLSPQEKQRKQKADDISIEEAVYMISEVDLNVSVI